MRGRQPARTSRLIKSFSRSSRSTSALITITMSEKARKLATAESRETPSSTSAKHKPHPSTTRRNRKKEMQIRRIKCLMLVFGRDHSDSFSERTEHVGSLFCVILRQFFALINYLFARSSFPIEFDSQLQFIVLHSPN